MNGLELELGLELDLDSRFGSLKREKGGCGVVYAPRVSEVWC